MGWIQICTDKDLCVHKCIKMQVRKNVYATVGCLSVGMQVYIAVSVHVTSCVRVREGVCCCECWMSVHQLLEGSCK